MNLFSKDDFIFNVKTTLRSNYATSLERAEDYEIYNAVSKVIMRNIGYYWESDSEKRNIRSAYYLSSEYLMGRALGNNLYNLGIYNQIKEALAEINIDFNRIENIEQDAGLGNGGLGRLAACFLDSAASHQYSLHGYGIRYEYGIFKQVFENGKQVEKADNWLKYGDPWSIRSESEKKLIEFSDQKVYAVPYDTPIVGYDSPVINTLRLWKSEPIEEFNFELFNNQEYDRALSQKNRAEDISRVLYPNDSRIEGKILRLKQQYFFVSASIQDLIAKHKLKFEDLRSFGSYNAIQLNDTHPAVAVAELIRVLHDHESFTLEESLEIAKKSFSYTNHTILSEALEKWDEDLYRSKLPRIHEIISWINSKLYEELKSLNIDDKKINEMMIIQNGQIHMAHLAIFGSKYVNGVAEVHTQILKDTVLYNWHSVYPEKIKNVTNGVTQRRWLHQANPELSDIITKELGYDNWINDLEELKNLEQKQYNKDLIEKFEKMKLLKKQELADYILEKENIEIDPLAIYDIQIKRLHEYKRQLLFAFYILDKYYKIKEEGYIPKSNRVHIFGAKSAPGYKRAKGIIQFILAIQNKINSDPDVNKYMKVVFVTNYNVTYAQKLFPAGDLSEQISTAGKEASGTGNMKFMINGAITIGTLDGANIEIVEEAGEENNFIFGLKVNEINELRNNYIPHQYYENVNGLKRTVDSLIDGTFNDDGSGIFREIYDSLLYGNGWEQPDQYFILADFEDYRNTQEKVDIAFNDKDKWNTMCLANMIRSSKFTSDRSIETYSQNIWDINPVRR